MSNDFETENVESGQQEQILVYDPPVLVAAGAAGGGRSKGSGLFAQLRDAHCAPQPQARQHPRGGAQPGQDCQLWAAQAA
ncbi:hypothetical protein CLOM_g789 [Closterium sp. NIES-68]|nr:hypothetical protein CLOM_g789 [Closterium sp. NIES-68]